MLDYDSARSRYNKQSEKPSEDPTKLPKAEQDYETAKETYEMLNTSLVEEIPQLLSLRIPFFDPTFEAMIRMQSKFAQDSYEKMSGVQRYFPDDVRDDYASGQLDAQVEAAIYLWGHERLTSMYTQWYIWDLLSLSTTGFYRMKLRVIMLAEVPWCVLGIALRSLGYSRKTPLFWVQCSCIDCYAYSLEIMYAREFELSLSIALTTFM
jgi:hypothetical protein